MSVPPPYQSPPPYTGQSSGNSSLGTVPQQMISQGAQVFSAPMQMQQGAPMMYPMMPQQQPQMQQMYYPPQQAMMQPPQQPMFVMQQADGSLVFLGNQFQQQQPMQMPMQMQHQPMMQQQPFSPQPMLVQQQPLAFPQQQQQQFAPVMDFASIGNQGFVQRPMPSVAPSGPMFVGHAPFPQMAAFPVQSAPAQPFFLVNQAGGSFTSGPNVVVAGTSVGSMLRSSITDLASSSAGQNSSQSQRPPTDVSVWGYAVVDQCHPSLQRVPIPPSVVTKTKGEAQYNNVVQASSTRPCTSTVCMKFTTKSEIESCPAGEGCANFHIERSYLDEARAVNEPLCCGLHNDYFTQEMMAADCVPSITRQNIALVLEDRSEIELMPYQLAWTVGVDQLPVRGYNAQAVRLINVKKQICRLHLEGKCKWTKDCGHVHICRELHALLSKFHFPSLIFLLSTETSREVVFAKISENPSIGEFIRSSCAIPLVSQLIEKGMKTALGVLLACGVALAAPHIDLLVGLGVPLPETLNIVPFPKKLLPFLQRHQQQHQSPMSAAARSNPLLDDSTTKQRSDGDGSLGLPTFMISPGASVTSMPGYGNDSSSKRSLTEGQQAPPGTTDGDN